MSTALSINFNERAARFINLRNDYDYGLNIALVAKTVALSRREKFQLAGRGKTLKRDGIDYRRAGTDGR